MTLQSEDMGKLVADGEFEESLARMLFYKRWPGKEWAGGDVSRSYWRRKARAQIAAAFPAHREAQPETDGGGEIDAIINRIKGHAKATGAAWLAADVDDLARAFLQPTPEDRLAALSSKGV